MPRLASLGLGLGPDAAAAAAAMAPSQPSSQPSSSTPSSRASANKKRRAAVAGAWGQRLRAAGIETAEELLVLAPDSAAARLLSSKGPSPPPAGGREGAPQQQPPPRGAGRPVGRKELERLQAAVAARVAPPPLLHPAAAAATSTDDANGVGNSQPHEGRQPQHGSGGQRGQKRPRSSSASASSSSSSSPPSAAGTAPSPFPLPRLGRAVRTTAWDEWRHVAGGGVGDRVLPTGCRSIDRLLARGGLPFHEVCEVLGPSAAGKTQLCLSLAAQASLGLGAGVVYLDSTGAFCARRLRGILLEQAMQRQQQPPPNTAAAAAGATAVTAAATAAADAALGRVRCLRVADDQDLLSALDCLGQRLLAGAEEHRDLRLLVVDSIRGPLAPILAQPGGPNGLYLMGVVGKTLNYLSLRFGLCVVVVNGVVADRGPAHERASTGGAGSGGGGGGGGMHAMWGFKPALGPYWSTFPSLRLLLRPLPPSSSSSSTWRLGHEAGGGGDEQPLLCEAALYSAAHQDALPPAPPANAHVVGSKRAFFTVTAAGVVDPPTRATPPPPPTTTTTTSSSSGTNSSDGGGGGGPGVIPPYQPQSARGGT